MTFQWEGMIWWKQNRSTPAKDSVYFRLGRGKFPREGHIKQFIFQIYQPIWAKAKLPTIQVLAYFSTSVQQEPPRGYFLWAKNCAKHVTCIILFNTVTGLTLYVSGIILIILHNSVSSTNKHKGTFDCSQRKNKNTKVYVPQVWSPCFHSVPPQTILTLAWHCTSHSPRVASFSRSSWLSIFNQL